MVDILGIPFDKNSSYMKGSAEAPRKIRQALHSYSTNLCAENGIDLSKDKRWHDAGDLKFSKKDNSQEIIEKAVGDLLSNNRKIISLGGDHSITFPIIKAYSKQYKNLNIFHLDAHPDLYDELDGNKFSHACTFARIMENELVSRLVQVGIRTMNPHQRGQAERFGAEVIEMKNLKTDLMFKFDGPVYLSLDMDVLDPAFAPGISHHEPGGMSTRELLRLIQNMDAEIVGADIVEYNPARDLDGVTGMVAAKLLKEIIVKMI